MNFKTTATGLLGLGMALTGIGCKSTKAPDYSKPGARAEIEGYEHNQAQDGSLFAVRGGKLHLPFKVIDLPKQ